MEFGGRRQRGVLQRRDIADLVASLLNWFESLRRLCGGIAKRLRAGPSDLRLRPHIRNGTEGRQSQISGPAASRSPLGHSKCFSQVGMIDDFYPNNASTCEL